MSKVVISGNASGTGVFTVASPNSNTDRVLTLPDESGTVDTLQRSGNVIQVVQNTHATQVSTTGSAFVSSGLTATITPKSSSNKILVFVTDPMRKTGTTSGMALALFRDSSSVYTPMSGFGFTNPSSADWSSVASFSFLDSPATASAVTYSFRFHANASGTAIAQIDGNANNTASIILMEIAG